MYIPKQLPTFGLSMNKTKTDVVAHPITIKK